MSALRAVIFVRDVPGRGGGAGAPAHTQAGALPQRVQRETAMLADDPPVGGLDGSRFGAQIAGSRTLGTGRSPMKQMPVLSGLSNTGKPAACAMART